MKVGTLLLDQSNNYLVKGVLPQRPSNDKAFLKAIYSGQALTTKGVELLPRSIVSVTNVNGPKGILTGIQEIGSEAHLLLINRAQGDSVEGEKFRLSAFEKVDNIEVWVRRC